MLIPSFQSGSASEDQTFQKTIDISKITGYSTGASDEEGEIGEIAKYSPDNQKFYLVNGKTQTVDIVSLSGSYTVICH
ncbi:hypothetical protein [Metabacillus sp. 84]|uniref:hypothetical protein n=1 Tax=Metabacillus sp. 84 TaxID=3404705 RepID=UPI003CE69F98